MRVLCFRSENQLVCQTEPAAAPVGDAGLRLPVSLSFPGAGPGERVPVGQFLYLPDPEVADVHPKTTILR